MRRIVLAKHGKKERSLSRRRAIRHHCLSCSGFDWGEVVGCRRMDCMLFRFRTGSASGEGLDPEMRKEAIRRFCRTCIGGGAGCQADCSAEECALFSYRK